MLPPFAYARPDTAEEAVALLSEERVAYCGGTELLLAMRAGLHRPEAVVDLKRIASLRGVREDGDVLVIGATTPHQDIADSALVKERVPLLAEVELRVGNARVRAQGSIGGNLCFAEPKSDITTALIAFHAEATLLSQRGVRTLSVADLIAGPYFADKEPDELLVDLRVPVVPGLRGAYVKFQVTERPTVGVAVLEDSSSGACRVVVGAVGEVPVARDFPSLGEVDVEGLAAEVDPVSDLTGSVDYKRHVTGVFVRRAVASLGRAKEEAERG